MILEFRTSKVSGGTQLEPGLKDSKKVSAFVWAIHNVIIATLEWKTQARITNNLPLDWTVFAETVDSCNLILVKIN